jgi:hypothetical protein
MGEAVRLAVVALVLWCASGKVGPTMACRALYCISFDEAAGTLVTPEQEQFVVAADLVRAQGYLQQAHQLLADFEATEHRQGPLEQSVTMARVWRILNAIQAALDLAPNDSELWLNASTMTLHLLKYRHGRLTFAFVGKTLQRACALNVSNAEKIRPFISELKSVLDPAPLYGLLQDATTGTAGKTGPRLIIPRKLGLVIHQARPRPTMTSRFVSKTQAPLRAQSKLTVHNLWPTRVSTVNIAEMFPDLPPDFNDKVSELALGYYARVAKKKTAQAQREGTGAPTAEELNHAFFEAQYKQFNKDGEPTEARFGDHAAEHPELLDPNYKKLVQIVHALCREHALLHGRPLPQDFFHNDEVTLWSAVYTNGTAHPYHAHE